MNIIHLYMDMRIAHFKDDLEIIKEFMIFLE